MTLEQAILEKVRSLPLEKQQEILDFAEFLVEKSHAPTKRPWSSDFLGDFQKRFYPSTPLRVQAG